MTAIHRIFIEFQLTIDLIPIASKIRNGNLRMKGVSYTIDNLSLTFLFFTIVVQIRKIDLRQPNF
jgi:hypothetical protein